ncbi:hypothetical protein [Mesorhizobium sp.]|jgi:raffinose/stachyose/melibiose transport system permease protein|uniref:hypothetical protein n=1 Tax=Mesorhizobium sp. TaxID=1871066 RepID=UPI0025B95044|nr:hypothetical protein [Mesorhizobium sp.]
MEEAGARQRLPFFASRSRPALVVVAIRTRFPIWNDFFFPLVLIIFDNLKTLPQGLTVFVGEFTTD